MQLVNSLQGDISGKIVDLRNILSITRVNSQKTAQSSAPGVLQFARYKMSNEVHQAELIRIGLKLRYDV
jgi:hypothetical protein